MKLHKCLICQEAVDFSEFESYTTGCHLHVNFTCNKSPYPDAYGYETETGNMIADLITGKCWVDGSSDVPVEGCVNYSKKYLVNDEVEKYVERREDL